MSQRIQFSQHGGPEVLEQVDVPLSAPAAGEVRVRNHAIGLNFIDTYFRSGLYQPPSLPSGLGTEVPGWSMRWARACSICSPVIVSPMPPVRWVPTRSITRCRLATWSLPDSISYEQAAAVMLKGLTCQYLLRQTHALQAGETVLFHAAAGGVGSIACQWAHALGARLIGVVGSAEKAARAKALGAWATIDRSCEDVVQRVLELTEGKKCPVVYDSVGKNSWEISSIASLRAGCW